MCGLTSNHIDCLHLSSNNSTFFLDLATFNGWHHMQQVLACPSQHSHVLALRHGHFLLDIAGERQLVI